MCLYTIAAKLRGYRKIVARFSTVQIVIRQLRNRAGAVEPNGIYF